MSKANIKNILIIVLFIAGTFNIFAQTVPPAGSEQKLLTVLKSDAPYKAKVDALRQLSLIATKDSVSTLSKLLADPKLSHMARYAMEPIPDPSVDKAFRSALSELKGPQLVGLIGSIGVRGNCQGCLAPLTEFLNDNDPLVAQAAARALGSIPKTGYPPSAHAMLKTLKTAPPENKASLYEGILRCADSLTENNPDEAIKIYNAMIKLDAPHQIRSGALRGMILASGKNGSKIIEKYLNDNDYIMFSAAVQAALENPSGSIVKVLSGNVGKLSGDKKIMVIQALGNIADSAAVPALTEAAKQGTKNARIAAIGSLAQVGDAASVKSLASLLNDKDTEVSDAVIVALASSPEKSADKKIMDMLTSSDTGIQLKAMDLIGRRRIPNVTEALVKATKDNDESVRTAAIALLGSLAKAEDFPVLIEILLNASGRNEIRQAERAITSVAARQAKLSSGNVKIIKAIYGAVQGEPSGDVTQKLAKIVASGEKSVKASNANFGDTASGIVKKLYVEYSVNGVVQTITVPENGTAEFTVAVVDEKLTEQVSAAINKGSVQQKMALLRILRATNSPKALLAINNATQDKNADIKDEAVSLLCTWPTEQALPYIMPYIKSSNQKTKTLALRGALRLIPLEKVSDQNKLSSLKQIESLTGRAAEKKLLINALSKIHSEGSLAMVSQYLNDNATKQEAAFAAVTIAEKIMRSCPSQVKEAMNLISTDNNDLTNRISQILSNLPKPKNLSGFQTMFNGKDLTGWEISGKCKWWVQDGQLIGTQGDNFAPGDLFTEKTYDDFELHVVYRVEWPCNTGVWFRFQSPGQAYQADILEYKNPVAFAGTLYCPGKMFLAANEDKSLVNREGWNTIDIRAKGDHVQTWINGNKIADVHDNTTNTGKIGFQIHPGDQFGKMKVVIKKIMIKEL